MINLVCGKLTFEGESFAKGKLRSWTYEFQVTTISVYFSFGDLNFLTCYTAVLGIGILSNNKLYFLHDESVYELKFESKLN